MVEEKNLTERALNGVFWMVTGSGVQLLLKIAVLAALARLISPKDFGLMGIASVAVEFSKVFTHMGVGPAIVQRKELEERHLTTGFTLSMITGIFFAGGLILSAPFLSVFFRMPGLTSVLRVLSLVFVVDSFTLIGQALMQRQMKFRLITTIEVISYVVGYAGVGILLGFLGWGVWALVMAYLCQAVLNALLQISFQPFFKRLGFDLNTFKELLVFSGGMTLAKVANYLALQGDNLVVGRTMGAVALGIYGRAYQFMAMPAGIFGNSLDRALFPAMAKVQDDKQKLGKAYLTGTSVIALIGIPLGIFFYLLAPEIVFTLLGPMWSEVILPFQILACSLVFRVNYKMSDSLARATGAVYKRAWRQLIYAILVIVGAYTGHFWGLYGVALGVVAALVINFLLMSHLSIQLIDITWLDILKAHWQGLILGLATGSSCFLVVTLCREYLHSDLATLLLTMGGVGIFLFLSIYKFPNIFIKKDQRELLSKPILKRFKSIKLQAS